jgi:hypothetical protein
MKMHGGTTLSNEGSSALRAEARKRPREGSFDRQTAEAVLREAAAAGALAPGGAAPGGKKFGEGGRGGNGGTSEVERKKEEQRMRVQGVGISPGKVVGGKQGKEAVKRLPSVGAMLYPATAAAALAAAGDDDDDDSDEGDIYAAHARSNSGIEGKCQRHGRKAASCM